MNGKRKSWKERALELLAEQQTGWGEETAGWEDWVTLGPKAVRLAAGEMKRRRRRGSGGVLPSGYDAESIAAEAVADVLEGKGHLAPGCTRERLVKELERLIRRKIRRLASLKETRVTEGGLGVEESDTENELAKRAREVPDGSRSGYDAVVAREREERREGLRRELERYLESEPELVEVFRCLWSGITKPGEIARRVGVPAEMVGVLRKRLERRMERFGREHEENEPKDVDR